MEESQSAPGSQSLTKTVALRFASAFLFMGATFFLPAGTFNYWQAWVYLIVLLVLASYLVTYLFSHDRKLLERRMRSKETRPAQKRLVAVSVVFFLATFAVPGLDHRFHWSSVPLWLVLIADALVIAGCLFIAAVFKANTHTSRIIEVEQGQKVITTGPYALVRHPMYLGVLVFYLFTPPALGSYWALIPALHVIPLLVFRIIDEEKELRQNLEGYREYTVKTRYRLVPGVW